MIEKRKIGLCILFTIITCGIYGIYWFVKLHNQVKIAVGETDGTSAGVAFLLTLVTCNIYGLYWSYKQGEKLDQAFLNRGMPTGSRSIIYLVLSIFSLGIVACALMQDSLNKIADVEA